MSIDKNKRNNETQSSDKKKSRRKVLHKLGLGGAVVSLTQTWGKPSIDSVVLPSHAATTTDS